MIEVMGTQEHASTFYRARRGREQERTATLARPPRTAMCSRPWAETPQFHDLHGVCIGFCSRHRAASPPVGGVRTSASSARESQPQTRVLYAARLLGLKHSIKLIIRDEAGLGAHHPVCGMFPASRLAQLAAHPLCPATVAGEGKQGNLPSCMVLQPRDEGWKPPAGCAACCTFTSPARLQPTARGRLRPLTPDRSLKSQQMQLQARDD